MQRDVTFNLVMYCLKIQVNMKGLYEKYGLKCERVDSKDFEANDRVVMAAKLTTTKNKMHSYVQAAMHDMDQNMADLNHPVGY
ncbi:hypothetical protein Y032_0119g862 [Ancylostoma ceylanicum]|uniref:Uncharacterized protein n=1 Tax=Ancylostoma ceylanicum TaxID=53326 RepID=A0A016TBB8_9BILA|nr:hypothetical protein Y032_0119g862 [Ancylostoma ceylanicum]